MARSEYVYLINLEGTPVYKFGKAQDPDKLLAVTQARMAKFKVVRVFNRREDREEGYGNQIHARIRAYHLKGDWYCVPDFVIDALLAKLNRNDSRSE